jgi:ABC-2 type transport system permease protein
MRKMLRLVSGYFRHNLMSAMAYRGPFIIQVLGMLLNDAMLLFFWWVLFNRLPSLQGWTLSRVMTLYGIVAFGFGAATVVCGNAFSVARIIVRGDLDYYLALPADPLLHLLVSRMSLPAWGDMLFGLLVFLVAAPEQWKQLPLFILLSLLAGVVFVAFSVLVGSLAFWVGNADNLAAQAINAIVTFGLYPAEIFPGVVRLLLYTLIPAAFVGSLPAQLLDTFEWSKLVLMLAFVVAITLAARLVFRLGLRRYESGNLVTVRG